MSNLPSQSALSTVARIEWQTVALALVIYGGFFAVTWFWHSLPLLVVIALGGWLIAWHGSLQHEVIHGHPRHTTGQLARLQDDDLARIAIAQGINLYLNDPQAPVPTLQLEGGHQV